jgi:hypothetical protein
MTAHCMAVNMTKVKEVGADKYLDTDKHTWSTEGFLNTVDALYKGGYENVAAIYCGGQGGDQGTRAIINNMYGGTFTDDAHTKYTADSAENIKAIQTLYDTDGINFDASIAGGDEITLFRNGTLQMAFCWNIAQQLNADNNDWLNWQSVIGSRKVWRFSPNAANSDFTATNIHVTSHGTEFTLQTPTGSVDVLLPLPGRHNIANALAAAALSMSVGATLDAIKAGLANLKAVPGRLFPIQLAENQLLLDDSYNANVGSMTAAVQVLAEMPGYRVLVVGDMAELGAESEACHVQVGEAAKAAGIDRVLSVGKQSHAISTASGVGEHFADKTALITRLKSLIAEQQVITILVHVVPPWKR